MIVTLPTPGERRGQQEDARADHVARYDDRREYRPELAVPFTNY